jgi:hypothetical protein
VLLGAAADSLAGPGGGAKARACVTGPCTRGGRVAARSGGVPARRALPLGVRFQTRLATRAATRRAAAAHITAPRRRAARARRPEPPAAAQQARRADGIPRCCAQANCQGG